MESPVNHEFKQADNEIPVSLVDSAPKDAASVSSTPTVAKAAPNPCTEFSPGPRPSRAVRYYTTGSRWITIVLSALTIICGYAAIAFHWSSTDGLTFILGMPLFLAWTNLLILTTFRVAEKKSTAILHTALPLILGNTMTTWGAALAGLALTIAPIYSTLKAQKSILPTTEFNKVLTIAVAASAYSLYLLLVALLIFTMFTFARFYRWLASQPAVRSEISSRYAAYAGGLTGLCFGFAGLWLSLNVGQNNPIATFAVHTAVWAVGVAVSEHFFSAILKALDHPNSP